MWPITLKVLIDHPALKLLAMTSMRSELGKIELNKLFQSRKELNSRIREMLEETTKTWGITCDRYEILKIEPPSEIRKSMQLQAEAERMRRKEIILSEAKKISDINIAEGKKQSEILKAEAQAEALEIKARKEKEGLQLIAKTVLGGKNRGTRALDYILKRKYFDEYANIIKNGNVTILPESSGEGGSSSDVLGAVAMMMAGNQMKGDHYHHPRSSASHKDDGSKQSGSSKPAEKKKSESGFDQPSRTDSNVDWNALSFFNNPSLDSSAKK